jgi:hypothetical protein
MISAAVAGLSAGGNAACRAILAYPDVYKVAVAASGVHDLRRYLAYWGEKSTGGYSLVVESARLEGGRVTVTLALREPPRDAIVTQALTYPYAVAVVRDLDPRGKDLSFTDQNGRELGWPVRLAGG